MRLTMLVALALQAGTAHAQVLDTSDARIVAMPVTPSGYLRLRTASDVTQSLLFRQGERITSVILSDPTAFFVTVAGTGDSLALRAASPSAFGVMSVRTSLRSYEFELMTGPAAAAPAVVRLVEQAPRSGPAPISFAAADPAGRVAYRLSGSKALRPAVISDDGAKTFIEWPGDQAVPATFALGPTGDEQMVDGYMRGGIYTIDRVYQTLVFRIDKQSATATRISKGSDHD
jgi:type IV secretory pathway VirB9-like protein